MARNKGTPALPFIRFVIVVLWPVSFQFGQYLLLYPDLFLAPDPDLVAFEAENDHAGCENRPEVIIHDAGEMVEKIEAG